MNERTRDAFIGLCTLAAAAGIVILLYLFNEVDIEKRWQLQLHAPSTGGLGSNSSVALDGVPIGIIESVALTPTGQWPVRIVVGVNDGISIPMGVTAMTKASLLTGGANLYLESPAVRSGQTLAMDGSAILTGPIQSMTVRDISDAFDERVGPTLETFNRLGAAWSVVGEDVSSLLGGTGSNGQGRLASILQQVDRAARSAADWLDNPALRDEVTEFMHMALAGMDRAVTSMCAAKRSRWKWPQRAEPSAKPCTKQAPCFAASKKARAPQACSSRTPTSTTAYEKPPFNSTVWPNRCG